MGIRRDTYIQLMIIYRTARPGRDQPLGKGLPDGLHFHEGSIYPYQLTMAKVGIRGVLQGKDQHRDNQTCDDRHQNPFQK
jgi:hypothetical protein